MNLDIRLPLGLMFFTLGLLLTAFGAWSSPAIYRLSLGIDINLYWGIILSAFGLLCILLSLRQAPAPVAAETREEKAE